MGMGTPNPKILSWRYQQPPLQQQELPPVYSPGFARQVLLCLPSRAHQVLTASPQGWGGTATIPMLEEKAEAQGG